MRDLAQQVDFTLPGSAVFLLLARPPDPEAAEQLAALADRGGLAVLAAGDWDAARTTLQLLPDGRIDINPGKGQPSSAGTEANRLDVDTATTLAALVDSARTASAPSASATPGLVVAEAPRPPQPVDPAADEETEPDHEPTSDDDLDAAVAAFLDPENTSVPKVAFLGPVQVSGPGDIQSRRIQVATEVIIYLATHGRSTPSTALDAALWPDRAVLQSTRHEAVSRARIWLGTDPDGNPHLSRSVDGVVSLSPAVLVDWDLFTRLAARGAAANGHGHRDLATALRLVRGQPFARTPPKRYSWLPETYLEQDIAAAVVDTAHRLATHRLAAEDPQGARLAARTAQLVDRYDERPWRDLLLAEHQMGNRNAVNSLVDDLMTTLEADIDDDLTEETRQLIEQLADWGALRR